jgi:hypothetical protein
MLTAAQTSGDNWIDVESASSWDLPLWLANGVVDSIELANGRLCRDRIVTKSPAAKRAAASDTEGKPRDKLLFPQPTDVGRWNERIYYHVLNCGLRIPPTAGSGSGEYPNPVGYNRVYAYTGQEFNYDKFWEALRAGRVTVTNGPLLRPVVEGEMPGYVFEAAAGQEIELEIGLTLSTRDPISYVEVVRDGIAVFDARLDQWQESGGKLPKLKFNQSGWFLIRAVANVADTYRFATTAPYYVEIGERRRISRASAQFFLDWVNERAESLSIADPKERAAVEAQWRAARDYWQALVERANSD